MKQLYHVYPNSSLASLMPTYIVLAESKEEANTIFEQKTECEADPDRTAVVPNKMQLTKAIYLCND